MLSLITRQTGFYDDISRRKRLVTYSLLRAYLLPRHRSARFMPVGWRMVSRRGSIGHGIYTAKRVLETNVTFRRNTEAFTTILYAYSRLIGCVIIAGMILASPDAAFLARSSRLMLTYYFSDDFIYHFFTSALTYVIIFGWCFRFDFKRATLGYRYVQVLLRGPHWWGPTMIIDNIDCFIYPAFFLVSHGRDVA